ncbi:uncharacterized protein [Apostichopus japonicus]|uniref:uncharacterized protein n=1 Tax=Stichopus japonicus TaxID=307972 RepID=UPI003AB23F13
MESFLWIAVMLNILSVTSCISYDSYSYDYMTVECLDFEAKVDRDSIEVHAIVVSSYETSSKPDWKLMYNITWAPPDEEHEYSYKVKLQQRESDNPLTRWVFFDCQDYPEDAHDVMEPFFVTEALFTHESLFQVVPIYEDSLTTNFASYITFETPDCYRSTGDTKFCANQSVWLSGAPVDLHLVDVIKYVTNDTIVPSFEWSDPVQVNPASNIVMFMVTVESESGELLMSRVVRRVQKVETYNWMALYNITDHGIIQEGLCYKLKVMPFLSTHGQGSELLMGYTSEILFWTDVTKVVYNVPSSSSSSNSENQSDDTSGGNSC